MMYRIRCTMATRCMGELLPPKHDYIDTLWVGADSEQSARYTAIATWPYIRTIEDIQQVED